jgi:hypothetical protein
MDHDVVHPRSAIWPVGSMIADPLASYLAVKVTGKEASVFAHPKQQAIIHMFITAVNYCSAHFLKQSLQHALRKTSYQ